jgi:CRP-like cAMP-binding protein
MATRILLIEDNPEMRENTAEILELANYDVNTAENGKIGVEMAKAVPPDLIICDIMMPELDGYGVLYMLSKDPTTASIPFIFLTAKTETEDWRKGMELGADDYVTKPFAEMDLLNAIEMRLKKRAHFSNFKRDDEGLDTFLSSARSLGDLKELSKDRKTISYKKKEIIYREGERPNKLLFINTGKVKVYKMNDDGKELITDLYKEGDFFGHVPLLEDTPYEDWATALEDCEISIIPKEDFLSLIHNNRDVSLSFIRMLSNNVAEKEEQLLQLAYDTVRKRIAQTLLLLREKYQKEGGTEEFSIAFSRDDLSKIAGTAKETTIRALSDLKEEGLIEIKGSAITISNVEGLSAIEF